MTTVAIHDLTSTLSLSATPKIAIHDMTNKVGPGQHHNTMNHASSYLEEIYHKTLPLDGFTKAAP